VLLFYKYLPVELTPEQVVEEEAYQRRVTTELGLQGRVLLAPEGVNGTVAAPADTIKRYCDALIASPNFGPAHEQQPIDFKTSETDETVLFPGMTVTQVPSICGGGDISRAPLRMGGKHLSPAEWHEAIQQENIVLLDCRNDYEYAIGRFQGATDPGTRHFNEFAEYVRRNKAQWIEDDKKVLMYCTGGIRCEKASAFIRSEGVDNVSQLRGGIHRYLEAFPDDGGLWKGKNFVFDSRVSMGAKRSEVVGRCALPECRRATESLGGNKVCAICKNLVLVCDACDAKPENADLFCAQHARFRGAYSTCLEGSCPEALKEQRAKLDALLAKLEAEDKTQNDGKNLRHSANRNRRRMLRRQTRRVDARLASLEGAGCPPARSSASTEGSAAGAPRRCRSCGITEGAHDGPLGSCWGFWRARARREETPEETAARERKAEERYAAVNEEKAARKKRAEEFNEEFAAKREAKKAAVAAKTRRKEEKKARRAARLAAAGKRAGTE
jgi:predicted sulfurtransferase